MNQLQRIDQLATQINADGKLDYTQGDGATIFQLLTVLDGLWPKHPTHSARLEAREHFLNEQLQWLDNIYGWKHSHQTEAQKDQVFKAFVYMHLYVIPR